MKNIFVCLLLLTVSLSACTKYETKYVGFRHANDYQNRANVDGMTIGAEAYADAATAKEAFGFNIHKAGLLPVLVVMDNRSGKSYQVVREQTFLVDAGNRYWNLIANKAAVDRVNKATQSGAILSGAGKGAALGAATGAILGSAFGVLTGNNVGTAAGKGAAVGAAGGAVYGGATKGTDTTRARTISDDIRDKGLEGKTIPDQGLANGFLFFPAEAKTARELRLQFKETNTGKITDITLPF